MPIDKFSSLHRIAHAGAGEKIGSKREYLTKILSPLSGWVGGAL